MKRFDLFFTDGLGFKIKKEKNRNYVIKAAPFSSFSMCLTPSTRFSSFLPPVQTILPEPNTSSTTSESGTL